MQRVDTPSAISILPSQEPVGTPGFFTKGDPAQSIPATVPGQDWFNSVQEELIAILSAANVQPDKSQQNQVITALASLGLRQATSSLPGVAKVAIPSGTIMLFGQTSAPTGWTKLTDHNDKALRVVSGTASSGGSTSFSSAFANRSVTSTTAGGSIGNTTAGGSIGNTAAGGSVSNTTLDSSTLPSHDHSLRSAGWQSNSCDGLAQSGDMYIAGRVNTFGSPVYYTGDVGKHFVGSAGSGNAHTHTFSGTNHSHTFSGTSHGHAFSGASHNHTLDMTVQYVDVIRAQKD